MAERFRPEEPPSPNGQRPPSFDADDPITVTPLNADMLLTLLINRPHLQRAIKRDPNTDPARHGIYNALLAEAAIKEGWDEAAIISLIHEGNTRNSLPPPPVHECRFIIQEAHLRTKTGDVDFAREYILDNLSNEWGIGLANVIRHGTENALWHLRLDDGREIQLGSSQDLMMQTKVRARIFDVTGHLIPRYARSKADVWDHHVELLAMVATTVDTPEMTREGKAKALVLGYLEGQNCRLDRESSAEEWVILALRNKPFVREGHLYLSVRTFLLQHVHMLEPKMSQSDVFDLLRLLGGRRTKLTINEPKPTSRRLWCLPVPRLVDTETADFILATMTTSDDD